MATLAKLQHTQPVGRRNTALTGCAKKPQGVGHPALALHCFQPRLQRIGHLLGVNVRGAGVAPLQQQAQSVFQSRLEHIIAVVRQRKLGLIGATCHHCALPDWLARPSLHRHRQRRHPNGKRRRIRQTARCQKVRWKTRRCKSPQRIARPQFCQVPSPARRPVDLRVQLPGPLQVQQHRFLIQYRATAREKSQPRNTDLANHAVNPIGFMTKTSSARVSGFRLCGLVGVLQSKRQPNRPAPLNNDWYSDSGRQSSNTCDGPYAMVNVFMWPFPRLMCHTRIARGRQQTCLKLIIILHGQKLKTITL